MHPPPESTPTSCSACSDCPAQNSPVEDESDGQLLVGWRFGLASMGLFLAPVALAVAGATCFGESQGVRLLGAIAGLAIGMAGSVAIARLLRRNGALAN